MDGWFGSSVLQHSHGLTPPPPAARREYDGFKEQYGDLFTIPIPFNLTPPFTFLTTRAGYQSVLSLSPDVGRNGPIIDRVPALAHWTPRSDPSSEHLQTLLLTGRRYIGARLRERRGDDLQDAIRSVVKRHVADWGDRVDLAAGLVGAIHEASARLLLGDELWDDLGPDAPQLVRTVVNAVDAARAATALSPAARLLPEYRAVRELGRRLLALATAPDAGRHPFVQGLKKLELDGQPFPDEDVAWMMFFAVWNATLYTGTYGLWSYLDLLTHEPELAAVQDPSDERADVITGGIIETMRMNPISWQLRSLAEAVEVEVAGTRYQVPQGHYLSVFSHGLNRDGAQYPDPLAWKPRRYIEGEPAPLLFGAGPFNCVAQRWVKLMLATIHAELLDTLEVTLEAPLPKRVSRVHLLYPTSPVWASVRRRPRALLADPS